MLSKKKNKRSSIISKDKNQNESHMIDLSRMIECNHMFTSSKSKGYEESSKKFCYKLARTIAMTCIIIRVIKDPLQPKCSKKCYR